MNMFTRLLLFLFIIMMSCINQAMAQLQKINYGELPVLKKYSIGSRGIAHYKDRNEYSINGMVVDKKVYDHYKGDSVIVDRPVIYRTYDINDTLIHEAIFYGDCQVGYCKEFYPGGKLKMTGQFKENTTGNWENISERGYCSVKDGVWKYYSENGKLLYSETWKNDQFIGQSPLQNKTEIWKYDLLFNGKSLGKKSLRPGEVRNLKLKVYYKNNARDNIDLSIRFRISATGHKPVEKTFTPADFQTIDVLQMIRESGIEPDKGSYSLEVFNNGKYEYSFDLDILY